MVCWNCGESLRPGAVYCPACGSRAEKPPDPTRTSRSEGVRGRGRSRTACEADGALMSRERVPGGRQGDGVANVDG